MKKILFIILLVGFATNIQAQRTFADPSIYSSVSSVNDASTFQLRQSGQTKTITWATLNSLLSTGSNLTSQTNNWTANQSFVGAGILFGASGYIQLPSAAVGTTTRQIWFDVTDSTIYLKDASGASIPFKSQAHNDATYATSGGATDLPATYMTLSTSQLVNGSKTFSGTQNFTNKLRVPIGATTTEVAAGFFALKASDSYYPYYTNSSGTWKAIATQDWVTANYPVVSGYLSTSGTQTGITSNLTWSSGYLSPYDLRLPTLEPASATNGSIWVQAGAYPTLGAYDGNGDSFVIPSLEYANALTKSNAIGYDAPSTSTSSAVTLRFTDRNYIKAIYTPPQDGLTFTVNDDSYGAVSFIVVGTQESVSWTMDTDLTNGIKWVGGVAPSFDYSATTKYYEVLLKRLNATTILGSWTYYQ